MKIAVFHNVPPGGAKRVVFGQVKYLLKKNKVEAFEINTFDNDYLNLEKITKVKRYDFDLNNNYPFFLSRLIRDYNNFFSYERLHKKIAGDIDKGNFDVIIVHPDKFTQAPFLLKFLKTPSVYYCEEVLRIVHEAQFKFKEDVFFLKKWYEEETRKIRKKIDMENTKCAKLILSNSKYTSDNIKKAYNIANRVCYPGVDTDFFKPLSIKKENDILFIGEKLNTEGFNLLEDAVKYFKRRPKIRILSRINNKLLREDSDMVREYNNTKIAVALSCNEPLGLIPLEAMSCAVPVIGVREGGVKETIIDEETGFLVRRNPHELYTHLDKLLFQDGLREQMGKNARKHILLEWNWNKRGLEFLREIRKIIK